MKNKLFLLFLICLNSLYTQNNVKNVIVMIPDGTSTTVLSLARYYHGYLNGDIKNIPPLSIDPYICGLVRTHCSNAPIGDSAPTSSWYSTGEASRAGYVAMYPPRDGKNDLVEIDSTKTYQPLLTILEAAKLSGKKTGLVFTCQFPHATPADFSAHWYNRSKYDIITKQIVHNDIDVIFGSGIKYLTATNSEYLVSNGYDTIINNISRFRNYEIKKNSKVWALFGDEEMQYDLDRDPNIEPSLAEMTAKAIKILSNSSKGFFLMVEGSKVDWAAHANDPIGVITDFLAFDKAVDTAIYFAKQSKNGETIVIVLPDHSTGGITFGNENSNGKYSKLSIAELFEPIVRWKKTAWGAARYLAENFKPDSITIQSLISDCNPNVILTSNEIREFISTYSKGQNSISSLQENFLPIIIDVIKKRNYIGFTTKGHTGEDVFLAIYDKSKDRPTGLVRSYEINKYLCKALNIIDKKGNPALKDSTEKYFSKHYDVFHGYDISLFKKDSIYKWDNLSKKFVGLNKLSFLDLKFVNKNNDEKKFFDDKDIFLIVRNNNQIMEVPAYRNYFYVNGVKHKINSVTIYVDKNETFYLPRELSKYLKK